MSKHRTRPILVYWVRGLYCKVLMRNSTDPIPVGPGFSTVDQPCPRCEGEGVVDDALWLRCECCDQVLCPNCKGQGIVPKPLKLAAQAANEQ